MPSNLVAYIILAVIVVFYLVSRFIPYYKSLGGEQRGHRFAATFIVPGFCLVGGNIAFLTKTASDATIIATVCSGAALGLGISLVVLAIAMLFYWHG